MTDDYFTRKLTNKAGLGGKKLPPINEDKQLDDVKQLTPKEQRALRRAERQRLAKFVEEHTQFYKGEPWADRLKEEVEKEKGK